MLNTPMAITLPIYTDEYGVLRVSETRITLHTLLKTYQFEKSPEALHEAYPTIPLADVYAIVAYYLAHQEDVDDYLQAIDEQAEAKRRTHEATSTTPTREQLLARLNQPSDSSDG
jgi:uncharacterized protein (DUF433 family)